MYRYIAVIEPFFKPDRNVSTLSNSKGFKEGQIMSTKFQGKIVTYCGDASAGVVVDTAGQNYVFNTQDWLDQISEITNNLPVEFDASSGRAIKVRKR